MFPIRWNFPFRKKDGSVVNISDAMSGGGGESELPPHNIGDAGKLLKVNNEGNLAWADEDVELPTYSSEEAGKVLAVDNEGNLEWVTVTSSRDNRYEEVDSNIPNKTFSSSAKEVTT